MDVVPGLDTLSLESMMSEIIKLGEASPSSSPRSDSNDGSIGIIGGGFVAPPTSSETDSTGDDGVDVASSDDTRSDLEREPTGLVRTWPELDLMLQPELGLRPELELVESLASEESQKAEEDVTPPFSPEDGATVPVIKRESTSIGR